MLLQIPGILGASELDTLSRELREAGFADGRASAGLVSREVKNNLQLPLDAPAARKCAPLVLEALRRNSLFFSVALPHRVHGPVFNRYDPGMTYGDHVDNAVTGAQVSVRTDVAATLFLTPPDQYDGGELVVQDNLGAHRVKLAAGSIIVYPAGSVHRVEPVTRGSRLAAILWAQSMVRDAEQRRVLFDLDLALGSLRQRDPVAGELTALTSVYHNMLRMWAET
jgi:PKHD-type hydroxylase